MTDLVTVQEAAGLLGLTYQGVDYLIRAGRLPIAERVGPVRRVRRADVERLRERPGPGRPVSQPPAGGA